MIRSVFTTTVLKFILKEMQTLNILGDIVQSNDAVTEAIRMFSKACGSVHSAEQEWEGFCIQHKAESWDLWAGTGIA